MTNRLIVLFTAGTAFALAGCAHVNNPYIDSSAAIDPEMNTASSRGYAAGHSEFGRPVRRQSAESEVRYENGAVTHWPLWFEDPFEDKGNRYLPYGDADAERDLPDNEFAWNWVDYFHAGYGPARLVLNVVGFPASAVVQHPGMLMESDGRISRNILGYDHDATRSDSVTREPPDVNIINKQVLEVDER
jgi:hypothetical protein